MKIPVVFSAFLAAVLLSPGAVLKSVAAPPVIDAHPESTTNLVGESVVFVVVASSPDGNDLSYQWRRGGTALSDGGRISGARSEVLQIDNLATTDTGNYSVVVTDTVTRQSVTSANAFLRVLEPPRITGQPANQVVVVGRTATFTVRASGTPPLRYQWLADGVPIAGATNATLTLTNVQPDQEGDYVVVVENEALAYGADAAASEPATLTVLIPPRITNHPDSIVAVQGDDVLFSVEAEGTDTEAHPLRYQWRFKGRDLIGETDALLEVLDVQPSDAGEYSVRVYNDAGSVISSNAILTVLTPPVFTLHPAGRTVTAGTRVTFTAMATGTPPVAYQWLFNGDPIPGATNATYSFLATSTAQAGLYSVVASNVVDDVESRAAGLVVVAETVRPTVSITAPPDGFRTTNALVTIHGRAQDNAEVAFVEYQVNGGPFLRASTTNRWTNWTATFVAVAGSNVVRAVAEDTSHNRSVPTPPRRITHVVLWPLTLLIQGNGRVTGATNGQRLEIGRTHTIRAMPALRHLFTEWSGGLQSTNPTLVFEMRTNLLLRASFVTNPFVGLKGTYQGLFAETNAVRNHDRSGSFTLTVAEAGTFSANFQIGTRRLAAAGRFDWLGRAWLTLNVSPGNLLAARLQLDVTNYSAWVEGTLSNQFWQARLLGYRPAPAGAPSPPWAGRHTAVLLPTTNSPLVPGGEGPLTLTLTPGGLVQLMGALADGSRLSLSVPVGPDGRWPLYAPLYRGGGSVWGWGWFTNRPDSSIEGALSWIKPPAPGSFYPAGFNTAVELVGSRYAVPPRGARILALTNGEVIFTGGSLTAPLTNRIVLTTNNTVTVTAGTNRLSLRFTTGTGAAQGSFVHPVTQRVTRFDAVVLQQDNTMAGYFLSTNQSGSVILIPSSP